jgi:hypothetical protein
MIAGLGERNPFFADSIDQPVFLGDAAGPDTRPQMAEWFRFADSVGRVTADGFDEFEDSQCGLAIRGNPVRKVTGEIPIKYQSPLMRHLAVTDSERLSMDILTPSP